jgi:Helicase associated domain
MTFPLPHGHAIRITADSERTISTVHTALAESPTWRPPPTPRMITVEEHEQSLARERDRHEAVVRRMGSEIVRLKAAVKAAKDSAKEVKRKAQEELREAVKEARHNYAAAGTRKRARAPGNKHEVKWQTRFEELTAYKELHGHCNVEKHEGNKDLRQW